ALAEDGWRDELGADVGLAELFFVHRGISVRAESPRLLAAVCCRKVGSLAGNGDENICSVRPSGGQNR
ncbi:MAG: hypothetical protein NT168_16050, partial [Planctomycetota bacterium]|nr:hypothetical protein [Planctomycetota bacterium]